MDFTAFAVAAGSVPSIPDRDVPVAPGRAAPAVFAPRRPNWGRMRPERRWTELGAITSLFVHGMILAIVLLARHVPRPPPPPPPETGMEMVFEHGQKSPIAVPHPKNRFIEIPKGDVTGTTEQPATPPAAQPAQPSPEVNLDLPPWMTPPVPQTAQPEPTPAPSKTARQEKARPRPQRQSNPFANMALPSFAQHAPSHARGLRNSRSVDLSMGPVIEGGQLRDAVPHIASAGADGDYMERLSEYVESHKYYPEQAGRNGEQGTAVVSVLMSRDGTVKDVRLEQSSESRMLDVALESMFRDKRLPPFPDDMKEPQKEFTISMTYEIDR